MRPNSIRYSSNYICIYIYIHPISHCSVSSVVPYNIVTKLSITEGEISTGLTKNIRRCVWGRGGMCVEGRGKGEGSELSYFLYGRCVWEEYGWALRSFF